MIYPEKATSNIIKESLKDIKALKKSRTFLVEDIKTFEIAVETGLKPVRIFITEEIFNKLNPLISNYPQVKDKMMLINNKELQKLKQLKTNRGIIGFFKLRKEIKPSKDSLPYHFFFDRVQDPGNMGTIIRSALNFNIRKLYLSEGTASIYNPKVIRGSMGAVFLLPIEEKTDFKKIFKQFREDGKRIYFTSSTTGKTIDKTEIKKGSAILFGNESSGISEEYEEFASDWVKIPSSGKTESLSVSIAASIIMYDLFVKHLKKDY